MNRRDRKNAKNVWITRQLEKQKVWNYLRFLKRMNTVNEVKDRKDG